ncbi:hypothetical protein AURDEDRAFT_170926 [Auricularia subglabra TFB-10046 SS5]|nr:hypothetical protein AURDEDRAFT_170926 [Auricularia subglabra TFB-10046 SS5]
MKLRDALLAALAGIPGPRRTYAVHVLVGAPKTTQDVYPYVAPRPKFSMQEIFVLCSEEIEDGKRVFVAALEAALYTHAPTRTAFLYVAKVDSTGQATQGAPAPTRTLVSAFVNYFADPKTRPAWFSAEHGSTSRATTPVPPVEATPTTSETAPDLSPSDNAAAAAAASTSSATATGDTTLNLPAVSTSYDPGTLFVHVFARAQGQYLFPNSADYAGKRVRGDAGLCRWWRSALSEAARDAPVLGMYYIVPGMDADEAVHVLGGLPPPGSSWVYGHPYGDASLPWPARGKAPGVAGLVPWFEDDAKSRFIDDLAATHDELAGAPPPSPRKKKRRRLEDGAEAAAGEDDAEKQKEREKKRLGDLAKIGADEFWERIGFRQECSQGAITGFFVCAFGASAGEGGSERRQPGPTEAAQRRAVVASGTIARVRAALMKQQEFSSRERAVRSTGVVEELVRTLLCDSALAEPASRPASRKRPHGELGREDSPGAVQAGPGHAELYAEHVFGTAATRDEAVSAAAGSGTSKEPQQPAVTVLAVRRKKK